MVGSRGFFGSALFVVSLLLGLGSGPVSAGECAYVDRNHKVLSDDFHDIGFTLCREHFAPGTLAHEAVEYVCAELNAVQGSALRFSIAGYDDHREYHDALKRDGKVRLDIVKPEATRSGDASFAGRTFTRTNLFGQIREFDIVFNRRSRWNFGMPTEWAVRSGEGGCFRNVMMHEVGHGLGFPHCQKNVEDLSMMGARCGKWVGMKQPTLKAHDHGHIRFHYGKKSKDKGRPDLVLGNYKTRQKESTGLWKCTLTDGVSKTEVVPGESLTAEWTLFNTGGKAVPAAVLVRAYLSSDESVDSKDVVLGEVTIPQGIAGSATDSHTGTFTVPADAAPGRYHVVLVADAQDTVDEQHEDNNLLVLHRLVQVASEKDSAGVAEESEAAGNPDPEPGRLFNRD